MVRGDDRATPLQTTTLVNEAWLKLAAAPRFKALSHLHFKRIAARAMRQVPSRLRGGARPTSGVGAT